jgi:hypothetical protein
MKKLIIKYIIIHIAAILVANLIGILFYLIQDLMGYDYFEMTSLIIWGPRFVNYAIRAVVILFVLSDMLRINKKVNYLILLVIVFDDYLGTAFFLLSFFFQDYKSINTIKDAKSN